MLAIFKREVQAYYFSPIGYSFMGFFLVVTGVFFSMYNIYNASDAFGACLSNITFIFMLLVPVLTMRLMSEDRKNKTDQMTLTAPISLFSIVFGKYLAAIFVFLMTIIVMLIYPVILMIFGNPSIGEMAGGMIGFFLLGSAFIALGLFMSSLSESQVTAAASTFAVLLVLYVIDTLALSMPGWLQMVLSWFSLYSRFDLFGNGLFSPANALYYLSFSAVMLFLTIRNVDKRRWSES